MNLRQSDSLVPCHLLVGIARIAGISPVDDEFDRVDPNPSAGWHLAHFGADQGKNPGRVAVCEVCWVTKGPASNVSR